VVELHVAVPSPRFARDTRIRYFGGELVFRYPEKSFEDAAMYVGDIAKRSEDLSTVFEAFQPIYQQQTIDVFAAEGLPVSWPRLSPAYEAWKAANYPGQTINRRTDRMYDSLTGGPEGFWRVRPRSLQFGTFVPYWKYTQRIRPTIVWLPDTANQLRKLLIDHVTRQGSA
jgi:hypothetical protein